jgi:hypothetical protein
MTKRRSRALIQAEHHPGQDRVQPDKAVLHREVLWDLWTAIRRRVDSGHLLLKGLVSIHRKTRHPMTCRI